jgi:hypothetical protein
VADSDLENDFRVGEGYRAFSAELLRISLIGVSAIAYLWIRAKVPEKAGDYTPELRTCLFVAAFACLCCTAACALSHMYFATDSLAGLVLYRRRQGSDKADGVRDSMISKFRWSGMFLAFGSFTLILGVILLIVGVMAIK